MNEDLHRTRPFDRVALASMSKQGYKCSPQIVVRPLGVCELRYTIEYIITHILVFRATSSIAVSGSGMRQTSQLKGLKCIGRRQPGPRWEHTPAFLERRTQVSHGKASIYWHMHDTESLAYRNKGG